MTKLNIKEADVVADVRTFEKGLLSEKEENSGIIFFGNLDIPLHEIDEAIKKLEKLSLQRISLSEDEI